MDIHCLLFHLHNLGYHTIVEPLILNFILLTVKLVGGNFNGVYLSLVVRKPVFGVSDQVRHKPGCTATEDGKRLDILYIDSRGIVLSM